MKVFNRTYLPDEIKYNGEIYRNDSFSSGRLNSSHVRVNDLASFNKLLGKKTIVVEVLSTRLKGVKDLHGNYYKPSKWIFTNK